jgi:hypothetical protein
MVFISLKVHPVYAEAYKSLLLATRSVVVRISIRCAQPLSAQDSYCYSGGPLHDSSPRDGSSCGSSLVHSLSLSESSVIIPYIGLNYHCILHCCYDWRENYGFWLWTISVQYQHFYQSVNVRYKFLEQSYNLSTNKEQTRWSQSASELYRPSDRRLLEKLMPTLADRSVPSSARRIPYGRNFDF